ncbi:hypothetical protein CBI38_31590 (plasmid) [Rhodococcus oxybenzonivorans]|uniref:Uncharacterized protein n=1 Tax=Rhodococcus oxybenzonivorans TaxID=1990687 RepID=A0A2S2C5K3_9NOCA|nr:hypothetical protein CBI38_31590 [Rhodococcus oxybenzonivorans]
MHRQRTATPPGRCHPLRDLAAVQSETELAEPWDGGTVDTEDILGRNPKTRPRRRTSDFAFTATPQGRRSANCSAARPGRHPALFQALDGPSSGGSSQKYKTSTF